MAESPKSASSDDTRVQAWHVDPKNPTGPLLDHRPKTKTEPPKASKPRPKPSRKNKS